MQRYGCPLFGRISKNLEWSPALTESRARPRVAVRPGAHGDGGLRGFGARLGAAHRRASPTPGGNPARRAAELLLVRRARPARRGACLATRAGTCLWRAWRNVAAELLGRPSPAAEAEDNHTTRGRAMAEDFKKLTREEL